MASSVLSSHIHYDSSSRLVIDGVDVGEGIVKPYGTPVYAYSIPSVVEAFRKIRDAYKKFHPDVSIHFSLKSNATFTIVKALVAEGAGIDCVSAGEVFKALKCGCPPDHIVFAGVGKTEAEIAFAVENGVCWFNVENELELHHLNRIAGEKGRTIKVALRLNPDVTANTHPNIATGHGGAKFGIGIEVAERLLKSCQADFPHLDLRGVHLHIGSQLGDTEQTCKAIRIALDLVRPFSSVKSLNIGGGMPVTYDGRPMPEPESFAAVVCPLLQSYHIMLEPGRSIVAPAGILLTRVLYRKEQAGHKMLIVDASMTELMRPALYGAKHLIVPVHVPEGAGAVPNGGDSNSNLVEFTVVGPVCETTDVLSKSTWLPDAIAVPGTLLAVLTAGAYGATMSNNYNARPIPPQICVLEGGKVMCAMKRQTYDDLIRDELDQ